MTYMYLSRYSYDTHVQLETATRRSNITNADAIFVGKQVPDAGS